MYSPEIIKLIGDQSSINKKAVIQALDGRPRQVDYAFTWSFTPQGSNFWSAVCRSKELSKEAKEILTELLIRLDSE